MTEAQIRQVLNGQRAQVLRSIWDRAWQQYVDDGRTRHYRARATVVWDNAVTLADAELTALPGVARCGSDDMPVYVFDNAVSLQLKKTTRSMRTSGYLTRARRTRLASGSTGVLEGVPSLLLVTCGYLLDKADAGIEAYPVVRTVWRRPEWHFDLREIAEPGEGLAPTTPVLPYVPDIPSLPTILPTPTEEGGEQE